MPCQEIAKPYTVKKWSCSFVGAFSVVSRLFTASRESLAPVSTHQYSVQQSSKIAIRSMCSRSIKILHVECLMWCAFCSYPRILWKLRVIKRSFFATFSVSKNLTNFALCRSLLPAPPRNPLHSDPTPSTWSSTPPRGYRTTSTLGPTTSDGPLQSRGAAADLEALMLLLPLPEEAGQLEAWT